MASYYSPRNPICALWASAVEQHLRDANPGITPGDLKKHPMMLGVYRHLKDLKHKKRQSDAARTSADPVDKFAWLSQYFLDLGAMTLLVSQSEAATNQTLYDKFIVKLDAHNDSSNVHDFSTQDLGGFGLCLAVWLGMAGKPDMSPIEQEIAYGLVTYIEGKFGLNQNSPAVIKINQFLKAALAQDYSIHYRDPGANTSYGAIPWHFPADAVIVMLGDWGTGLDDAHQFLYALWKQAYNEHTTSENIIFIHLGDIYYCGLPEECENYFYNVFVNVGKQLKGDLNDANFVVNPPVFTIPGNHEYYSFGYGYFQLLDKLNRHTTGISAANLTQEYSFFSLRSSDKNDFVAWL
jgi:hypothetical protein